MLIISNKSYLLCSAHRNVILSIFLAFMTLNAQAQDIDNSEDLLQQILSLQSQMGIKMTGLDRIQKEEKIPSGGSEEQQLEQLLRTYNHIISRDEKGQIDRVIIVNKKQKSESERIILPTTQQGNHFIVSVALSGANSHWNTLDMIIDTGADLVVLPESMIPLLGLENSSFSHKKMQTANGTADAKIGLLQEMKLAGETLVNVEVAFIADALLGNNRLLGMSVLGRYQLNIDEQAKLITLIKK